MKDKYCGTRSSKSSWRYLSHRLASHINLHIRVSCNSTKQCAILVTCEVICLNVHQIKPGLSSAQAEGCFHGFSVQEPNKNRSIQILQAGNTLQISHTSLNKVTNISCDTSYDCVWIQTKYQRRTPDLLVLPVPSVPCCTKIEPLLQNILAVLVAVLVWITFLNANYTG